MTFKEYKQLVLQKPKSSNLNFSIDGRNHYVYRITNTKLNKHYYGSRTTKLNPKEDLGIKYFSSSKDKEFKKYQLDNPQNYKYKVIKTFNNSADKNIYESYLHDYFNVKEHESFYNKANQTTFGFDRTGRGHTDEVKSIISKTHLNVPKSKEHKRKIGLANKGKTKGNKHPFYGKKRPEHSKKISGKNNVNYGKPVSEERRMKQSKAMSGEKHPMFGKKRPEISERMSGENHHFYNKKLSEEHKKNISMSNKGKYCGSKNIKAKVFIIFNMLNIISCVTHGNFIEVCKENNLPLQVFIKSYRNNGERLYQKRNPGNKDWLKYKGWYAIDISKLKFRLSK